MLTPCDVRLITVDEPYVSFERRTWRFKDRHRRMGRVSSQRAVVARAKRYLRAMLSEDPTYDRSFVRTVEQEIQERDDDDLPF